MSEDRVEANELRRRIAAHDPVLAEGLRAILEGVEGAERVRGRLEEELARLESGVSGTHADPTLEGTLDLPGGATVRFCSILGTCLYAEGLEAERDYVLRGDGEEVQVRWRRRDRAAGGSHTLEGVTPSRLKEILSDATATLTRGAMGTPADQRS